MSKKPEKVPKKQSLRTIVLRPMIIVHVIIVVLFVSTINTFDIIGRLRGGEVDNLNRAVSFRAKLIEQQMLSLGNIAVNMSEELSEEVSEQMEGVGSAPDADQAGQILELAMPVLSNGLRSKMASGAFVVLNGSISGSPEDGGIYGSHAAALYVLDEAVTTASGNSEHLMMLVGPKQLARNPVLPLDSYWSTEMRMEMFDDTEFLTGTYKAALASPDLSTQRLCRWMKPVTMNGNREAIMVTVPLRVSGEVIGLVGTELSLDRLRAQMAATELYDGESSFYALTDGEMKDAADHLFVSVGSFATRNIGDDADHSTKLMPTYGERALEMRFGEKATATCIMAPFNLYYQDSPFKGEQWALIGGVENEVLFGATSTLVTILIISFSATILIALIFAYLMSLYIERPLRKLSRQLSDEHLDVQRMQLEHTDIEEVDLLIESIETLSVQLTQSGQRTIRAIEMTGMPIGFVERDPEKGYVFMTDLAFSLLELRQDPGVNTISIQEWDEIYRRLLRHPAGDSEGVYHLQSPESTQQRYLRIRIASDQNRTFGILMDVTSDVLGRRELEHERDTDPLTSLYNRNAFMATARRVIEKSPGKVGIMLFADLDNLKYVNDTYGHDMGDRYIQSAAKMFGTLSEHGGIVSRISGDEFAVFLYGHEDDEPLKKLMLNLPAALEQAGTTSIVLPDNSRFKLRYSMGYAWYPRDSDDLDTLLRYADYAMYEIKRSSKGSMKHFSLQSYMQNSFLIEKNEAFNQVVEKNLVRYAFQPIVNVFTGKIYGYEALMRPDTPEFSTPYHLIRIAQTQAKLYQIERMTFFNVFQWIAKHEEKLGDLRIFLNSIPDQMLSNRDFQELERDYGRFFRQVVMELTEVQQGSEEMTREKLSVMRRLGAYVALDDYGSGYSNEISLLHINPEFIKIDMTLVQKIDGNEKKQALVRGIVDYARRNKVRLIAEGVETRAELEWVIRLGVDYVQGYLIGMPEYELQPIPREISEEMRQLAVRLRGRRSGDKDENA